MKSKIYALVVSILLTTPFFLTSCTKEDNKAQVLVWQGFTCADSWKSVGVSSLTCYVNGQLMASQAATVYFNSTPNCSSNGGMKFEINLQKNTTGRINIIVKDQNGLEWYNEQLDIKSSDCNLLELI